MNKEPVQEPLIDATSTHLELVVISGNVCKI